MAGGTLGCRGKCRNWMNTTKVLVNSLPFAPTILILVIVWIWGWRERRGTRKPIKEKMLRAPGETLRRQMERFDENIVDYVFGLILYGFGCFLAFGVYVKIRKEAPHLGIEMIVFWVVVLIVTLFVARKAIEILRHQRNLFLGFQGERAVGEELNKLMLDGCLVFHDIPSDADWNVDHVVVAPTGVFAIETKTRRKGKCPKGKRDYEVIYDGRTLEFPHCRDSHGIDQAKANAKWLSRHLSNPWARKSRCSRS